MKWYVQIANALPHRKITTVSGKIILFSLVLQFCSM